LCYSHAVNEEKEYDYTCGLIGFPVKHSLSPKIHRRFAEQFDIDLEYKLIETPEEKIYENIATFFANNGHGLNITIPHKTRAYHACSHHSMVSKITRTVNTIWYDDENNLCGDNTDATALLRDIRVNQKFDMEGKRVLVLGTGGAAQAVLPILMVQKPSELYISSRTFEKAEKLAASYGRDRAHAIDSEKRNVVPFDLIINATPASLYGELPNVRPDYIGNDTHCMDMAYTKTSTMFCDWSQEQGAKLAWDGLGMLIEQAADAFFIWFKQRPDTYDLYKERYSLLA